MADWLHNLILGHARAAWIDVKRTADRRSEAIPEYLVATQHGDWDEGHTMTHGDAIRTWTSRDDFTELVDPSILPVNSDPIDTSRSLFVVPILSFYISADRKQVLICRHLGPRYGNGGWWDVTGQGDTGKLTTANRRSWIA